MDGVGQMGEQAAAGEDAADGRSRKRDSLFLSARVRFGDEPAVHDVRVRNLSAGGLMAEHDRVIAPATAVALEMRGLGHLTGTVAWCAHGRLGIALDHPIDPARARKPVGAGKASTGTVRPLVVPAARR